MYTLHFVHLNLDQPHLMCSMATWGQWLPYYPVLENLLGSTGLRNNVWFSDPRERLRANRVGGKRRALGGTSENRFSSQRMCGPKSPWEEGAVAGSSGWHEDSKQCGYYYCYYYSLFLGNTPNNFLYLKKIDTWLPYNIILASAAATAKSLQLCPTLCNPIDGSPTGSPSLGFFRQEHWSGLPFPSPMHQSGKWKWSCSVVSNSSQLHGL